MTEKIIHGDWRPFEDPCSPTAPSKVEVLELPLVGAFSCEDLTG